MFTLIIIIWVFLQITRKIWAKLLFNTIKMLLKKFLLIKKAVDI